MWMHLDWFDVILLCRWWFWGAVDLFISCSQIVLSRMRSAIPAWSGLHFLQALSESNAFFPHVLYEDTMAQQIPQRKQQGKIFFRTCFDLQLTSQNYNFSTQISRTAYNKLPRKSVTWNKKLKNTSSSQISSPLHSVHPALSYQPLSFKLSLPSQILHHTAGSLAHRFYPHRLVLETLEPLSADRKCFRMINGVLVERTVKDVVPALKTNSEGLRKVLEDLVKQYNSKQTEMEKWKVR